MHLSENRGLRWFVLIFTIAVLLGLQYGWTACAGRSRLG
jgi:uncharacterized membrane protein (DUF441 family)